MTPVEFHEACHDACYQCPQFRGYDDDTFFQGYGEFGDIPSKGWTKLIRFWKDEAILWETGYYNCLPPDVLDIFTTVDDLLNQAIEKALGKS